MFDSFI